MNSDLAHQIEELGPPPVVIRPPRSKEPEYLEHLLSEYFGADEQRDFQQFVLANRDLLSEPDLVDRFARIVALRRTLIALMRPHGKAPEGDHSEPDADLQAP
jgi:hypothetical protein